MTDLVEEYKEEVGIVEEVRGIGEWVDGMGVRTPMLEVLEEFGVKGIGEGKGMGHARGDSGVGMEEDEDGDGNVDAESGVGFGVMDAVFTDAGSISERDERVELEVSAKDVEHLPIPPKNPRRAVSVQDLRTMERETEVQLPPRSAKRVTFDATETAMQMDGELQLPPKSPKRLVSIPAKQESPIVPASETARPRMGKLKKVRSKFRDSAVDVSSPVGSLREKPRVRWVC